MIKSEWEKAVEKECERILNNHGKNPHQLLCAEALVLAIGLMTKSGKKIKFKHD